MADINDISKVYFGFWQSSVLRAAIKLDLFSLLENNSLSEIEICEHLNADPDYMKSFLNVCIKLGFLEKKGEYFLNSLLASEFLVPQNPLYQGDYATHITNFWETWGKLDDLILQGKADIPLENNFVEASSYWDSYIKGRHNLAMAGQSQLLTEAVPLEDRSKLLDMGGGSGSYSIALCKANTNLKAVILDLPEPLQCAAQILKQFNLEDRVTLLPADFHTVELENDYDTALFSAILRLLPEKNCLDILSKTFDALISNGLLIIQEFISLEENVDPTLHDVMMDLFLKVGFKSNAGNRSMDEIEQHVKSVGFRNFRTISLPNRTTLILANK